jgi:hypothetical protein
MKYLSLLLARVFEEYEQFKNQMVSFVKNYDCSALQKLTEEERY